MAVPSSPTPTPQATARDAAVTHDDQGSSQRLHELLDEVARKDSALQQFRDLFERMSNDYELLQRRREQIHLEMEMLTTKHEAQHQELITLKAKSALQESKIRDVDAELDRRTRQLRQELAAAIEERDTITARCETQWQQMRLLRSQVEDQRRQHSEAESVWQCKVEEARKEAEERLRVMLHEREELFRLREAELQRGIAQAEGLFSDVSAEKRRLQESNEALLQRVEELRHSLQRQEGMTQRLETALSVERQEKAQLSEYMALERQAHCQRQGYIENSYKAQVQEMQRLCEKIDRERQRQEEDAVRVQREQEQTAQRTREAWLLQQQQLESTIVSLQGEVLRERLRFDGADEARQRAEALLVRIRRELEASQQREVVLQETIKDLNRAAAKRESTHVRVEGEVARLLATVAERERETERWKCAAERMEWQARIGARNNVEDDKAIAPAALPPPPLFIPSSSSARPSNTQRESLTTPYQKQKKQQPNQPHVESIDCTPTVGSPDMRHTDYPSYVDGEQEDVLRSIVQEVLQEHMLQTEPFPTPTTKVPATNPRTPSPRHHLHLPLTRHASMAQMRRPLTSGKRHFSGDSPLNDMPSPSPLTRSTPPPPPPAFAAAGKEKLTLVVPSESAEGPRPSTATRSTDSSMLQTAAPLFTSTANNSSLESSTISRPQQRTLETQFCIQNSKNDSFVAKGPIPTSNSSIYADQKPDTDVVSVVMQQYAQERKEAEQQMRQMLQDLEQHQQRILSTIAGGTMTTMNTHLPLQGREGVGGRKRSNRNSSTQECDESRNSSIATSVSCRISSPSSSARASTAAPAPPSRLTALQERFAMMPIVQ